MCISNVVIHICIKKLILDFELQNGKTLIGHYLAVRPSVCKSRSYMSGTRGFI